MSGWRNSKLIDEFKLEYGKSLPERNRVDGNIAVYGSGGVVGSHNEAFIKEKGIIVGRKGSIGTVYYSSVPFFPIDTVFYLDKKSVKSNELKFIYYFLKSCGLESLNSDAAVPGLNRNWVHSLKANIPPLPIQKKIAAVLSAYDDLIENNNRRIEILEKMAEEIYKEWFVRMRFPGFETATFHKGIPEGWGSTTFNDFCRRVTDGTHDTPKPTGDGHYLITGKNLVRGFIDFENAYKISKQDHINISKRSGLEPWDILFSNIGTIGSIAVVVDRCDYSVKNVIIFKFHKPQESLFLYYMLRQEHVLNALLMYSSGASQQFIGLTTARDYKMLLPDKKLITAFGDKVLPLYKNISKLNDINQNLKQTRDRLLSRLISGKLCVDELDIKFPPSMQEENS